MDDLKICIARFMGVSVDGEQYKIDFEDNLGIPQHYGHFVHGNCHYHFSVGSKRMGFSCNLTSEFEAIAKKHILSKKYTTIKIDGIADILDFIAKNNDHPCAGFFQSRRVCTGSPNYREGFFNIVMTSQAMVAIKNIKTAFGAWHGLPGIEVTMVRCPYKWDCMRSLFNGFIPQEIAPPSFIKTKDNRKSRRCITKGWMWAFVEFRDMDLEKEKMHTFSLIKICPNHAIDKDLVDMILAKYKEMLNQTKRITRGKRALDMLETTLASQCGWPGYIVCEK
jgi:hypothetical protein